MDIFSSLSSSYVESLYDRYRACPQEVDPQWIPFFLGYEFARSADAVTQVGGVSILPDAFFQVGSLPPPTVTASWSDFDRKVWMLVQAYRSKAHQYAHTNVFSSMQGVPSELNPSNFFLTTQDLSKPTEVALLVGFPTAVACGELFAHLGKVYLSTMGVEFSHIEENSIVSFLCKQIESPASLWHSPSPQWGKFVWMHLMRATVFESFLQARYVGKKRFGLEGQESLIPGLQALLAKASANRCKEVLFCMAHRGRLNVLANVLQKPLVQIFAEFEEAPLVQGFPDVTWDVKYHLGFSNDLTFPEGKLHVSLAYNPSHLESVNGVLLGSARAKQDQIYQGDRKAVVPIILHGDAAVAGQGSVYEAACLYALPGYSVGGSIHIVLNNLVGFTAVSEETKSSRYCTDLAKMMNAPVFHVNAGDPLAVAHALEVAFAVRQEHGIDVFVEIVGYRKFGHNEGDDPRFTQPILYQKIDAYAGFLDSFEATLDSLQCFDKEDADKAQLQYRAELQQSLDFVRKEATFVHPQTMQGAWVGLRRATAQDFEFSVMTGVSDELLKNIAPAVVESPQNFPLYPKLEKILQARGDLWEQGQVDWAMAELLAYGSLLAEGVPVRLSGEDCQRGTFSHRHSVYKSTVDGSDYVALNHLKVVRKQAVFSAFNSPLSEYAVMAFDYGFSLSAPGSLVIWEAQFGDFVNGAQIVLDQYLCSAESKWLRCSGLVLFLPHGYEGQGPEHSSARLERLLQSCAQNNWIICQPSTPENLFHLLRRQIRSPFRKPLVVLTPKSLLRHPQVRSPITALTGETRFQEIYADVNFVSESGPVKTNLVGFAKTSRLPTIKKIVVCSGKVYYDALEVQIKEKLPVALVRIEQLYPFPRQQWKNILAMHPNVQSIVWLQEEPKNMGAARYIQATLIEQDMDIPVTLITRAESASPASGFANVSELQKKQLLAEFVKVAQS